MIKIEIKDGESKLEISGEIWNVSQEIARLLSEIAHYDYGDDFKGYGERMVANAAVKAVGAKALSESIKFG